MKTKDNGSKRWFAYIVPVMLAVLLIFSLTACGSDDPDTNDYTLYTGTLYYLHGNEEAGYLKFNEDGTTDIEIYHGTMYLYTGSSSGNYTEENGIIEIKFDSDWFSEKKLKIVDDYALIMHFEEDILIEADFYFIRSGRTGADYGIDGDGNLIEDDDDSESSILREPMTAQRAEEIYGIFVKAYASYGDYLGLSAEEATVEWNSYDAEKRTLMYQQFSELASELGLGAERSEVDWIERMDFNQYLGDLFTRSLVSLDTDNDVPLSRMQNAYSYQKGLEEGKYEPLDEDILAAADSMTVEYYQGSYLLCLGSDHLIQQMTYDWTMKESSFAASGSVTAVKTDDIFTDVKVDYTINGQNGVFENAKFGETDFLTIFKGIGATDDSGTFLSKQIDICTINVFDAEILYVLSQESLGIITVAVVKYDESQSKYIWDGQTYTARDRCCFNKDNEFCYVDIQGDLQKLTQTYTGGE